MASENIHYHKACLTTKGNIRLIISHAKETGRRRRRRRRSHNVQKVSPSILSLPKELVVKILALVAASSFTDFFRAKLSCKCFNELSHDDEIYRHISLKEFWGSFDVSVGCSRLQSFHRCLKSGNLDAMYREGVRLCFFEPKYHASGKAFLERAASGGHLGASYVFGAVLICKGDEYIQGGLELIGNIKTGLQMQECRSNLKLLSAGLIRYVDEDALKPRLLPCPFPDRKRSRYYTTDEDYDGNLHCKTCRLNREILHVWDTLTSWENWRKIGYITPPDRVDKERYEMCLCRPTKYIYEKRVT